MNVPEFALIALWGVALVSFSASAKRRRTTESKTADRPVDTPATLERLGTSVPRPA